MSDVNVTANASVDIGKNLTHLMEKLAQQIGTTVDKIFPWYVKQEVVNAYTFLFISVTAVIISLFVFLYFKKKSVFCEEEWNMPATLTIISGCCFLTAILILVFNFQGAVTSIINPEYNSLHNIIADMTKLLHG
jgi:hypothetical protein